MRISRCQNQVRVVESPDDYVFTVCSQAEYRLGHYVVLDFI
jgi:hypothetical protein